MLQFDATYEFTVEDGLITRRILILHSGHTFDFNVVADYERWSRDNHPEAREQLFAFGTILVTTVEQLEAHQDRVPRFLESRRRHSTDLRRRGAIRSGWRLRPSGSPPRRR